MNTCYTSWPAEGYCYGWTKEGHPWHGCERKEGHTRKGPWNERPHRCKCGKEIRRGETW